MVTDFEVSYLSIVFIFLSHAASQSLSHTLNITRGSQDVFTNPRCTAPGSCNCNNLDAHCYGKGCSMCRCDSSHQTFVPMEGEYGKCVTNDKLVFSIDTNHSFLVYQGANDGCMYPTKRYSSGIYLTVGKCDLTRSEEYWIWTKNKQLLNLYYQKCLEMTSYDVPIRSSNRRVVILNFCNATNERQLWQCKGKKKNLFSLDNVNQYIRFRRKYQIVYLYGGDGRYSEWIRYGSSDQPLCSQNSSYNGCYRYADGSAMVVIDIMELKMCKFNGSQCIKEKVIEAPIEVTNRQCSIQWDMNKFLNYSAWALFPFKEEIFTIVKKGRNLSLKVNLRKVSTRWQGQIIKLYIHCNTGHLHQAEETHCVLIKFSGTFKTLYPDSSVGSTPMNTGPSVPTSEALRSTRPNENITQPSNEKAQSGDNSSTVIIVVMCLLVVFLVVGSVLIYMFYKRKRCFNGKNSRATKNDKNVVTSSPSSDQSGAQTQNPIYFTEDDYSFQNASGEVNPTYQEPEVAAASECELYGPCEHSIYRNLQEDTNESHSQSQETTYNYATNDCINRLAQRSPRTDQALHISNPKYETGGRNSSNIKQREGVHKKGEAEEDPMYHVLEQGEIDRQNYEAEEDPVYHVLER